MSRKGEKLAVVNTGSDSITIIDLENYYISDTFFLSKRQSRLGPHQIFKKENQDILYSTNSYDNSIYKIDIKNKRVEDTLVVGCFPSHIARLDKFLLVTNSDSNSISIIDESKFLLVENISVGERPHDIKVDKKTQKVYVANSNNYTIDVMNIYNNYSIKIKLLFKPLHLFIGYKNIYVLCPLNNGMTCSKILILDIDTYEIKKCIDVEGVIIDLVVLEDKKIIYSTNIENGFIYKIFLDDEISQEKYYIGGMPNNLLLKENVIFITNVLNDKLHVFDCNKSNIITSINTGVEANGVILF